MGAVLTKQWMDGGNRDPGSLSHDSGAHDEKTTLIGSASTDQPVQVHDSCLQNEEMITKLACSSVATEWDKIENSKREATVELHTKPLEQVTRDRKLQSQNLASPLQRSTTDARAPVLTNLSECTGSLGKSKGVFSQDLEEREEESRAEMNLKKADDAVLVTKPQETQYIQDDRLSKEKQEGGLCKPANSTKQKETELTEYYQREMKLQEENLRESYRSEIQQILQEKEAMAKHVALYCEQECGKLKNQINSLKHCHMTATKTLQQQHQQSAAAWRTRQMQDEAEIAQLKNRVQKLEERYKEAHSRMQKAEQFIADQAIVDSASYADNSATPMLLQASADGVKSAIAMCASSILKFTTKHSLTINFNLDPCFISTQLDRNVGHMNGKVAVKMALEAFLCELLFQGFESSTFSDVSLASFEKPEIRRKQRLQDFQKLRYMELAEVCGKDPEFNSFLGRKAASMGSEIRKLILTQVGTSARHGALQAHQEDLLVTSELLSTSPSNPFYKSFLRLTKAVWQLHKLAFAFEPASAEILRVAPNSVFLSEYMEEHEDTRSRTVPLQEVEDEDGKKLVTLMNVPGFTVRNSVIRSIVCCLPSQITN